MKQRATPYFRTENGKLVLQSGQRRRHPGHSLTGDVRQHGFFSRILEHEITFWVYLPPAFSPSDPWLYPCLYLHDGQNVFDASTSAFGVEWGVDEAAERLILEGLMQPTLIVALANSPDRMSEYTPFEDPQLGGGGGKRYARFLVEELKPWMKDHYPVRGAALETAIAGSSLGGLSSLYLGWTRPNEFGLVAAMSPSLWWGGRKMITRIGGDESNALRPTKIWLDMGDVESLEDDNENGVPDPIDDLRTLKAVLLARGYILGQNLEVREILEGRHNEADWAKRIDQVLCWLFPPRLT
ncbi:MAG: alpha/beta hydrolase-fold protein [Vulcanimicrobiota bacterium]